MDSGDSARQSKLIEDLLTDWVEAQSVGLASPVNAINSQDLLAGRAAERSQIFEGLLESHRSYLKEVFPDLERRADDLGMTKATDAVVLGGDALHLSSKYREEQVTDWLAALLRFQPFPPADRPGLLGRVVFNIMRSPEYCRYSEHDKQPTTAFCPDYKLTREVRVVLKTSDLGKFDLVVESQCQKMIVFEVKVGDTNFDKNIGYRDFLNDQEEWRDAIRVMILPGRDLDILEREGSVDGSDDRDDHDGSRDQGDIGNGNRAEHVLRAFPPVRWETFLRALLVPRRRESDGFTRPVPAR